MSTNPGGNHGQGLQSPTHCGWVGVRAYLPGPGTVEAADVYQHQTRSAGKPGNTEVAAAAPGHQPGHEGQGAGKHEHPDGHLRYRGFRPRQYRAR